MSECYVTATLHLATLLSVDDIYFYVGDFAYRVLIESLLTEIMFWGQEGWLPVPQRRHVMLAEHIHLVRHLCCDRCSSASFL